MPKLRVGGRVVADLIGRTVVKRGRQVQLFEVLEGFGMQQSILFDHRVQRFRLHYGNKVYKTSVNAFFEYGIPYVTERHGPQYVLPLRYWEMADVKQSELIKEEV